MLLSLLILLACATFFYRVAEIENESGALWAGLSVLVYLFTWLVLRWWLFGCVGGQVALFIGITIVRAVRARA